MPTKIIKLDELLPEDKQVELAGHVYRLPGDIPVELYLRITSFGGEEETERDSIERLYTALLDLFRYGDPKIDTLPLSISQCVLAIGAIYGGEEAAADERPTKAASNGTRSGRSSRSRSRS